MRLVSKLAMALGCGTILATQPGCVGPQSGALLQDHAWHTERQVAANNRTTSCTLFSSARPFASGAGLDQVRLIIHRDGIVSLLSTHDPFDTTVRAQIGIRVDEHTAVLSPNSGTTPKELAFSAKDSAKLIDQFKTGRVARIQLALAPRRELLATSFSLDQFPDALQEYRVCEVMRAEQASPDGRPWRQHQATN